MFFTLRVQGWLYLLRLTDFHRVPDASTYPRNNRRSGPLINPQKGQVYLYLCSNLKPTKKKNYKNSKSQVRFLNPLALTLMAVWKSSSVFKMISFVYFSCSGLLSTFLQCSTTQQSVGIPLLSGGDFCCVFRYASIS